jgi:Trk K+ transport system NAD-binding subunit
MVIVAHEDDSVNMLTTLRARKMRPDIRIHSLVHDQSLTEITKNTAVDMVKPASVTVSHLLALSAVTKDLVGMVFSERIGTKEMTESPIFKSSKPIGKGCKRSPSSPRSSA